MFYSCFYCHSMSFFTASTWCMWFLHCKALGDAILSWKNYYYIIHLYEKPRMTICMDNCGPYGLYQSVYDVLNLFPFDSAVMRKKHIFILTEKRSMNHFFHDITPKCEAVDITELNGNFSDKMMKSVSYFYFEFALISHNAPPTLTGFHGSGTAFSCL